MKIKLLAFFFIVALISRVLVFAQSGTALVTLTAPTDPVRTGDLVSIAVQINGAEGVYGGSLLLNYDPLALEVVPVDDGAIVPGDFFGDQPSFTLKNAADAAAGSIEYALTLRQPAEPVSGAGTMGTVQFMALRDGVVELTVADASLLVPQFEEVNGRKIARKIDEMTVQAQNLSLNIGGAGDAAVVEQPQTIVDASQSETFESPPFLQSDNIPASVPVLVQPARMASPAMIAGVSFFILGLVMFTLGVGTYVRLRRQFSWQGQF